MKIIDAIYSRMINEMAPVPPETGGIIGGHGDIVEYVCFDTPNINGAAVNLPPCRYIPNVGLLNEQIEEWRIQGIDFYGVFHTHSHSMHELSSGDKDYIMTIMKAMPEFVSELYFPLVLPGESMVSYIATRNDKGIFINGDTIERIEKKCE